MRETQEPVTFSFGENWQRFLETVDARSIERATSDVEKWLGDHLIQGQRVVDIGSGSGLHSLVFHLKGAAEVVSFDADPNSVSATQRVRAGIGGPSNWNAFEGSILDADLVERLGKFNVVYAWGALHHTGDMWQAIENTSRLVQPGGVCWIAIYRKGPNYARDLATKRRYNRSSAVVKNAMIYLYVLRIMGSRLAHGRNPFAWNEPTARGMDVYHDIVDWLGGLPYETASTDEVVSFFRARMFEPIKVEEAPEGGCSSFTFRRTGSP